MKVISSELPEVLIIQPQVYRDERGFFLETYQQRRYAELGLPQTFVQDNHSRSTVRTLRGLHAQRKRPQGKLVRVIEGAIFDVAVDIRVDSPNFGRWVGVELTEENARQCYIPPGFAHGFCVVSEYAQVEYKCTDYYDPTDELHLRWDDPELAIVWPVREPLLSGKDRAAQSLKALLPLLPLMSATPTPMNPNQFVPVTGSANLRPVLQ